MFAGTIKSQSCDWGRHHIKVPWQILQLNNNLFISCPHLVGVKATKMSHPFLFILFEMVWRCCTLYVSQFLKKLTDPSTLLWITVQPPGSCLWSHHTCMRRLAFSGFTRYMPLPVWPSSRACRQSLNGPDKTEFYKNLVNCSYTP